MLSLDKDTRSKVLRVLADDEVETLSREVARLPVVPATEVEAVQEEFTQMCMTRSYVLEGGVEYAKKMLTEAFGADNGLSMVDRMLKSLGSDTANLVTLQKSDPRQLAKLIYNEHPQVIALVLSHLVPVQAAELLTALPPEIRADVAKRMAQLDQFSPEVVEKIASYIGRRLKALGEFSRKAYGGVRAVAEVMNRLDRESSDSLLNTISQGDATLSETIRNLMFVFEDLLKMPREDIKIILGKIDKKALSVALKASNENLRTHFTQCMSARGAEMFIEEMSSLGPVKIRDIEAARSQIITTVRQLQTEGSIGTSSAGDKYVE
jgi:flagellar motor switch protein FliG